jgi:diguanylate cyclase (GGDEF)-like protein
VKQPVTNLPEGTYVELVRSLFETLLPTMIMACSFLAVGILVSRETRDPLLVLLAAMGIAAAIARIVIILAHRKRAADDALDLLNAMIFERRFACGYFTFAIVLGLFGARAFLVVRPEMHMLIVGLLFGYGAGVAAGLSLRPWISVPSILMAIVPAIVMTGFASDVAHWATGLLLAVFLAGGVHSMLARYRSETRKITMRRQFSTLARRDDLTGLPNRLSLREQYEGLMGSGGDRNTIAVHCLDLDRFKSVNDRHGHPAGDALLKAVSERLAGLLRSSDFAARLGGDEFVIIQTNVSHPGEADMLARRVAKAIAQPFAIGDHQIMIGTSVGYALSSRHGNDLERLMEYADEALCQVKRGGGGIAEYETPLPERQLKMRA